VPARLAVRKRVADDATEEHAAVSDDCRHGVAALPDEFVSLVLYDDVYQRAREE
jgi:hypothetical protein